MYVCTYDVRTYDARTYVPAYRAPVRRYVCMSVCMSVCLSVCMSVCLSACLPVCLYANVCMYVCMYVCMHTCMHVWMSVCMFILLYICGDGTRPIYSCSVAESRFHPPDFHALSGEPLQTSAWRKHRKRCVEARHPDVWGCRRIYISRCGAVYLACSVRGVRPGNYL